VAFAIAFVHALPPSEAEAFGAVVERARHTDSLRARVDLLDRTGAPVGAPPALLVVQGRRVLRTAPGAAARYRDGAIAFRRAPAGWTLDPGGAYGLPNPLDYLSAAEAPRRLAESVFAFRVRRSAVIAATVPGASVPPSNDALLEGRVQVASGLPQTIDVLDLGAGATTRYELFDLDQADLPVPDGFLTGPLDPRPSELEPRP
jgi:hypothetical protein